MTVITNQDHIRLDIAMEDIFIVKCNQCFNLSNTRVGRLGMENKMAILTSSAAYSDARGVDSGPSDAMHCCRVYCE